MAQLEAKLCALEGAEACLCFGSGIAAAAGLIFSLLGSGDHLVMADTNYAGVAELGRDILPRMGIRVSLVDPSDPGNVASAIRPETKLIWLETPANPIMRLTDLAAVGRIAAGHPGVRVAVDSTFASPVATRPLELGAHYVMHSLTKYIGGHGDAMGGAVLGSQEAIGALRLEAGIHYGGVLSPFNAWLIMRGAATLPIRMKAHEENALAVARLLESHPRVSRVIYPGLPSHPQHELARRQMANFSGMLAFRAEGGAGLAERMASELRVVHYAVSLGHHRSLVFWLDTASLQETSFRLRGAQLESYRDVGGPRGPRGPLRGSRTRAGLGDADSHRRPSVRWLFSRSFVGDGPALAVDDDRIAETEPAEPIQLRPGIDDDEPDHTVDIEMLGRETGHRIGAIRQLRWSDIDLEGRSIRWRSEHEKNGSSTGRRWLMRRKPCSRRHDS